MSLRLGRSCSDGRPTNKIGEVLWSDWIKQLGGGWQTQIQDIPQESSGEAQAGGDVMRTVEVRIHHKSFPTNGRARFLEINAHDDHDSIGDFLGERCEFPRTCPHGRPTTLLLSQSQLERQFGRKG